MGTSFAPPLLVNRLHCDWLSINFHYPHLIQKEEQRQIIAEALRTIEQPSEAVKMGEYATAYQTKDFLFVNINKRFLQIQFQGKYFLIHGLIEAATLIKKLHERLLKLEKIENRKDTEIVMSISRIDIQKTKISDGIIHLSEIESATNLKSFSHLIYAKKSNGQYQILGETLKDKVRWKLRRYDKTAQIKSEYTDEDKKLFYSRYPDVPLERIELQITDTPFLSQFLQDFLNQRVDLVEILKEWNFKRKVLLVDVEMIGTSSLSESLTKTFTQKGLGVGLCKAHPSSILGHLKKINEWIDTDPTANPKEIIRQMIFGFGYNEEVAEEVKKIFFKI